MTLAWHRGAVLFAAACTVGVCLADDLTDKVLQAFQAQAPELRALQKASDELEVTGRKGPTTVYLDNVRKGCTANPDHCDDVVTSFVRGIVSLTKAAPSASVFAIDKVYPVLRRAGYAHGVMATVKDAEKQLIVRSFVDGIELLFVIDGDADMRFVSRNDLTGAGLTEQKLLEIGTGNVARLAHVKPEPLKNMPGFYAITVSDGLGSARTFATALWQELETEIGGPVAVVVPTRDWVLITRADQPDNVAKLRTVAGRIVRGEPYAVSETVMTRDGNGWRELPAP